MHTPIPIKVRVGIVLALSLAIFALIGWPAVQPTHPFQPMTVLFHHAPALLLLKLLGLVAVTAVVALLVGGVHRRQIAPIAVPAGLCVWAIASPGLHRLLVENHDLPARTGMYYRFAAETCIWLVAVLLAMAIIRFLAARPATPEMISPAQPSGHTKTGPLGIAALNNQSVRLILAFVLCSAAAVLLLALLARSGTAWQGQYRPVRAATPPRVGQAVFAVAAAVGLAVFGTHQLFTVRPLCFVLVAPFLAILIYVNAAGNADLLLQNEVAPAFVLAGSTCAAISPLQYIAVGTFAALSGYWLSVRAHRLRHHVIENA